MKKEKLTTSKKPSDPYQRKARLVEQLAAAAVWPGDESQQLALVSLLQLLASTDNPGDLAVSALLSAFGRSETLIDVAAQRLLASIQIKNGTVSAGP